jgi:6-phosphogluconolactonase (cycloisomerase 2 family)
MDMINAMIVLDERSYKAKNDLPRRFNFSKMARVVIVAATTTDKEWKQYLKNSEEGREIQAFLREKLAGKLGLEL